MPSSALAEAEEVADDLADEKCAAGDGDGAVQEPVEHQFSWGR